METLSRTEISPEDLETKEAVIGKWCRAEITKKYGTGHDDGETPKNYHHLGHTNDVYEAGNQIARLAVENDHLNARDLCVVNFATLGHDFEQNLGPGENEDQSVAIVSQKMRDEGIESLIIDRTGKLISATKFKFENGDVCQNIDPEDYATMVMADADLALLGERPEIFWPKALGLLREMKKMKSNDQVSTEDLLSYAKNELTLLNVHQFYTQEAREQYPHQQENVTFLKDLIAKIENR